MSNNNNPCTIISSSTTEVIHCNTALEQDSNNNQGYYTGEQTPSYFPSVTPRTPRPTRNIIPFVLSGTLYYDINANQVRESDVTPLYGEGHLGRDVEYNVGLGGVTVQLVECAKPSTTTSSLSSSSTTNVVTAVTIGVNVQGRPKLVIEGGMYNLVDIEVSRSYYINVKAPMGYLLTGGICNDEVLGWECPSVENDDDDLLERYIKRGSSSRSSQTEDLWQHDESNLGILEGRSAKCVSVDEMGLTDSRLDIGVMRLGDSVTFVIDRDVQWNFVLANSVSRERVRESLYTDGGDDEGSTLTREGLDAVTNVIAELFAVNLQQALERRDLSFVQIDDVIPTNVQYQYSENFVAKSGLFDDRKMVEMDDATTVTSDSIHSRHLQSSHSLSAKVIVKGHYNRGMTVKLGLGSDDTALEKLIQEVISDNDVEISTKFSSALLNDFVGYNQKCLEQLNEIEDPAFALTDYDEIHTNKGIIKLRPPIRGQPNVFSASCADGNIVDFLIPTDIPEGSLLDELPTTEVQEEQGSPLIGTNASVENTVSPLTIIIVAFVCLVIAIGAILFFAMRRAAKKKDLDDNSAVDVKSRGGHFQKLLGLVYKRNDTSEETECGDIEAGVKHDGKLDAEIPSSSTKTAESGLVVVGKDDNVSNNKEKSREERAESDVGKKDDFGGSSTRDMNVDRSDRRSKRRDKARRRKSNSDYADAPLTTKGQSTDEERVGIDVGKKDDFGGSSTRDMNGDSSDRRSKRRDRARRRNSNSDYNDEPLPNEGQDPLRRSICDLDVGTKRMKDYRGNSAVDLYEDEARGDFGQDKRGGRRHRRRTSADKNESAHDTSKERCNRRENYQCTAEGTTAKSSSRRRVRKHDPLRRSIDDSNIGLRSRGSMSNLNDAPKLSRQKSRKQETLRMSKDDSNIGLRTAVAAAAATVDDQKKPSRRKGRRQDPLRMSQDDSNLGLRMAREEVTNIDSSARRKKGRRQHPLRRSRCDLDIGTKREPTDMPALKDRSSKSARHVRDRKAKGERRQVVKRSSSK